MRGNEVLQYVKSFTEVRFDRQFDRTTGCICHQSTHSGELFDLFVRTTGSGIRHHKDVVIFVKSGKKCLCDLIIGLFPSLDNRFVTFFLGQKTTTEVSGNIFNGAFCFCKNLFLCCRHFHIGNRYRHRCSCRIFITERLDRIQCLRCLCSTMIIDTFLKDLFQLFLSYMKINFQFKEILILASIYESQVLADDLIENETSQCGLNDTGFHLTVFIDSLTFYFNLCMQGNLMIFISNDCFVHVLECFSFAFCTRTLLCQVIDTKDHIL